MVDTTQMITILHDGDRLRCARQRLLPLVDTAAVIARGQPGPSLFASLGKSGSGAPKPGRVRSSLALAETFKEMRRKSRNGGRQPPQAPRAGPTGWHREVPSS